MEEKTAPLLDHFRAYDLVALAVDYPVALRGQFDSGFRKHRLVSLEHFANPVDKSSEGIHDPHAHLNWYALAPTTEPLRTVRLRNQFGDQTLRIGAPEMLLVPTHKIEKGSAPPERLDHFKCYRVLKGSPIGRTVSLRDQFLRSAKVEVTEPLFFCVPVAKRYLKKVEAIHDEKSHLTIYRISPREHSTSRKVRDQFDGYGLTMLSTAMLAVPSLKLEWTAE